MTVDKLLEIIEEQIPESKALVLMAAAARPSTSTSYYLLEARDEARCLEAEHCEIQVEVLPKEIAVEQSAESETMEAVEMETYVGVGVGIGIGISPGLKELSKITGPYPRGAEIMAKKK